MKRTILLLLLLPGLLQPLFAASEDSLRKAIRETGSDTMRVKLMLDLCRLYLRNNNDTVVRLSNDCYRISEKEGFTKGMAGALINLGIVAMDGGDYPKAIANYEKAAAMYHQIGLRKGEANCFNNLGLVHAYISDYNKALEYDLKALELYRADKNYLFVGNCYNNIGLIYINQLNYEEAEEPLLQSVEVFEKNGLRLALANPYTNLGVVARQRGQLDKALEYYRKASALYEESGDQYNLTNCYNNAALIYDERNDTATALALNRKALEIRRRIGDLYGATTSILNIGSVYHRRAPQLARPYLVSALRLADSLNMYASLQEGHRLLALVDSAAGRHDSAFYHMQQAYFFRDSVIRQEARQQLADMKVKYDTEQVKKDNQLKDEELVRERQVRWMVVGVASVVVIFLFVMLMAYRAIRRVNHLLDVQRREVLNKNGELSEKNALIEEQKREITGSIRYARSIQYAVLPEDEEVARLLPHSFVLYRPRDIVSGDFYFVQAAGAGVLVAVADCTGHGVPGAFMSMIGMQQLREAATVTSVPGDILARVNRAVRNALHQREEADEEATGEMRVKDGMDIALCHYLPAERKLYYAGANRPLWILRKGAILEIKASKAAIAGFTAGDQAFTTHTVDLMPGDRIILSTDGYADQFGGPKGKKLMVRNMQQKLLETASLSPAGQKDALEAAFTAWKGELEQVDDLCVLGIGVV